MPIPASGQFKIFPSLFGYIPSGTYSLTSTGAPPPSATLAQILAYLTAGISDPPNSARMWESFDSGGGTYVPELGIYELQMVPKTIVNFDAPAFTLGTPISFTHADFPLGVRFYALEIWIQGLLNFTGRGKEVDNFKFKYNNVTVYDVSPTGNMANLNSGNFTNYQPFPNPGPFYAPNQMFGRTTGIQSTVIAAAAGGSVPNVLIYQHFMYGTYQSNWMTLTLNTPNANPGDVISISDSLANLTKFTKFKVYWKPDRNATQYFPDMGEGIELPIVSHTSTNVQLLLPTNKGLPYGQRRLYVVGVADETQNYFGEFGLAYINNTVIDPKLVNGAGIYTLIDDKRNDTYYDRSVTPSTTVNIKIP